MNKSDQDIRWAQRFANFKNAFSQLQAAVASRHHLGRRPQVAVFGGSRPQTS